MTYRIFDEEDQVDGNEILWEMCRTLWTNITLDEFEEALKEEGYEDFYMRVKIGLDDMIKSQKMFGGDGKEGLRKRYNQFINEKGYEELENWCVMENEKIDKIKQLKVKYHDFLSNQNNSTH
jgi:hypothetical protein